MVNNTIRLTITIHLTLMMTSAQVVETSVTTTDNIPFSGLHSPGRSNYTITCYLTGSNYLLRILCFYTFQAWNRRGVWAVGHGDCKYDLI